MVGTTIGHYRILALLGRGATSEVYLAHDMRLQRNVALKVLHAEFAGDRDRRHHFEREARALGALDHPGIVAVHGVERQGDIVLLSMEVVDGTPLNALIPAHGMPLDDLVRIGAGLAEAVGAAHRHGVIHRDLKPANVMVTTDGAVKVLDFGLAKIHTIAGEAAIRSDGSSSTTIPGTIIGTAHYMSPEQAQGLPLDARSDIFSLGVLLFHMATGRRPFEGDTPVAVLSSIIKDIPPPVTVARPDLPSAFARLVARCLEKNPRDRVQDALDLAVQLRDAAADGSAVASATPGATAPAGSRVWIGANTSRWAVAAILVAALAAAAAWQVTRARSPAPALEPRRIAVAPFANRTADPTLDAVGLMVADRIAQGLTERLSLDVVPGPVIIEAWPAAPDLAPPSAHPDRVRLLAERVGAAVVVSGDYYIVDDQLAFRGRMTDVRAGRDIAQFGPVTGRRTAPDEAVDLVRNYVVGEAAVHWKGGVAATTGIPSHLARSAPPVTYEVYQEFFAGLDAFGRDPRATVAHLERVEALYPHRAMVLPWLVLSYMRLGEFDKAEGYVQTVRHRMAPEDVPLVEYFSARLEGDWTRAYESIRAFQREAPQHLPTVNTTAGAAVAVGRPREALKLLSSIDITPWLESTSGRASLSTLADANHMLGSYEDERVAAAKLATAAGGSAAPLVRSLAALGRADDITTVIEQNQLHARREAFPANVTLYKLAADELRAHGHVTAARAMAEHAVRWMDALDAPAARSVAMQKLRGGILLSAERWTEAATLLRRLASSQPDDVATLSDLGVALARRGAAAAAQHTSDRLSRLERPHLFGVHTLGRARIAAALGERDRAVLFLQQAFSEGQVIIWRAHADPAFEDLAGYPPFVRLTAMDQAPPPR